MHKPLDAKPFLKIPGYRAFEQFSETKHSSIYLARRIEDGQKVILKVCKESTPKSSEYELLRTEFEALKQFDSRHIAKAVDLVESQSRWVLIREYCRGCTLREIEKPLTINTFFRIAIDLCQALGEMHSKEFMHRDLKPENLIFDAEQQALKIIDLASATRFESFVVAPKEAEDLPGTLAYMAPEQTGRTNRTTDERSDLYTVGAIFYELLTGRPPFICESAAETIHAHIAKTPNHPTTYVDNIPNLIAELTLKLLSKNPDDRYQTARGLEQDLRQALIQYNELGRVGEFALGTKDNSAKLRFPSFVIGRAEEKDRFKDGLQKISFGSKQLVHLVGRSGSGKSALLSELWSELREKHFWILASAAQKIECTTPYASLWKCFTKLALYIANETPEELAAWQNNLKEALGSNISIVTRQVPAFKWILGEQPTSLSGSPSEATHRLVFAFRQVLSVACRKHAPIIISLDNAQWMDTASLALLQELIHEEEIEGLFLVLAGRSEDYPPELVSFLDIQSESKSQFQRIELNELDLPDVCSYIGETLKCSVESSEELGKLVYQKVGGLPFSLEQKLLSLARKNILFFDYHHQQWRWDSRAIARTFVSSDIAEWLGEQTKELPQDTVYVLSRAALLGESFDTELLTKLLSLSAADLNQAFYSASALGLIIQLENAHLTQDEQAQASSSLSYRFSHNLIRESFARLLDHKQKELVHWQVVQTLKSTMFGDKADHETIFRLSSHLRRCLPLIRDDQMRLEAAQLLFEAAQAARQGSAFEQVLDYCQDAYNILDINEALWASHRNFLVQLNVLYGEALYTNGFFDKAEELLLSARAHAQGPIDRSSIANRLIDMYTHASRQDEAIKLGLEAFGELNLRIPRSPSPLQTGLAMLGFYARYLLTRLTSKHGLQKVATQETRESNQPQQINITRQEVHEALGPSTYLVDTNLLTLSTAKMARLAMSGQLPNNSIILSSMSLLFCGTGWFKSALGIAEQAELSHRHLDQNVHNPHRHKLIIQGFIYPWRDSLLQCSDQVAEIYRQAMEKGDISYAGYATSIEFMLRLVAGHRVGKLRFCAESLRNFSQKYYQKDSAQFARAMLAMVDGLTHGPLSADLMLEDVNEDDYFEQVRAMGNRFSLVFFHLTKAMILFWQNNHTQAWQHILKVHEERQHLFSLIVMAYYRLFMGMIAIKNLPGASRKQRRVLQQHARSCLKDLQHWTKHPDSPIKPLHLLMKSAWQLHHGLPHAEVLLDQCIDAANRTGHHYVVGIASDLASRHYKNRNRQALSQNYFQMAVQAYEAWGASALAEQTRLVHTQWKESREQQIYSSIITQTQQTSIQRAEDSLQSIDVQSLLRASRVLAEEIELDEIMKKLLQNVIQNAGAQKGYLILKHHTRLWVRARHLENNAVRLEKLELDRCPFLSSQIVRYSARTLQTVCIGDAAQSETYALDAYIRKHKPKSILCIPLTRKNQVIGLVYLENNLSSYAFHTKQIKTLETLATQAAISLENSQLIADQLDYERNFRRTLEVEVKERTQALERSNHDLSELNDKIRESLRFAGRIQSTLLPGRAAMQEYLGDHMILWQPKDIVGGDFYWMQRRENTILLAALDCTGHGVPAAFLTLLAFNILESLSQTELYYQPSAFLEAFEDRFYSIWSDQPDQHSARQERLTQQGLEIGLCLIPESEPWVEFSGAKMRLYHAHSQKMDIHQDRRQSIGDQRRKKRCQAFNTQRIQLFADSTLYLTTDGLHDQLGGPNSLPYGLKPFRSLLTTCYEKDFSSQFKALKNSYQNYKRNEPQIDDILLIGFKPKNRCKRPLDNTESSSEAKQAS